MGIFSGLFRLLQPQGKLLLSPHNVAQNFCSLITQRFPDLIATVVNVEGSHSPIGVQIIFPYGKELHYTLDSLYASYTQTPDQLALLYEKHLNALSDIMTDRTEKPLLLPTIKNQDWLQKEKLSPAHYAFSHTSAQIAYLPLAGDLVITFSLESFSNTSFLNNTGISQYVQSENLDDLYALAQKNFQPQLTSIRIESTPAGYMIKLDGLHDASLILFYDEWKHLLPIQGTPVFAVIARDLLIAVDAQNSPQVELLSALAQETLPLISHPLSSLLFTFEAGRLVLYQAVQHRLQS